MATDTVTDNSDDATDPGSLRYQLAHAHAGDTIDFAVGVKKITLDSTLVIEKKVTIEGTGPNSAVTIAGGGSAGGFSDFTIASGVDARFDSLIITRGAFVGKDGAAPTVASPGPQAGQSGGGAVTDYGNLTLRNSFVRNNTAVGGSGSDENNSLPGSYRGGGAGGSAAGGIFVAKGAGLDLVGRTNRFAHNSATGGQGGTGGGGIYAYGGNGGTGAHAKTKSTDGSSNNKFGSYGYRGHTTPVVVGPSGSGYGGLGGKNGHNGRAYKVSSDGGYTIKAKGSGGGGGGGNAFSDHGGPADIHTAKHDVVTKAGDGFNDPGTLRYAVAHAAPGDTITFAPDITKVTLSSTLMIQKNVTIEGTGANARVTIAGGGAKSGFTDFMIANAVSANFDGLNISRGSFQGAVGAGKFPTNRGSSGGGAINDFGTLTLSNSSIRHNTAVGGNGSDSSGKSYLGGGGGGSAAGGIYVGFDSTLNLVGTTNTFAHNRATGGDGGMGGTGTFGASGGAGGAGAYAATNAARGPSNDVAGTAGHRGDTSAATMGRSGAGFGGSAGRDGNIGFFYQVTPAYGGGQAMGSGGGGGGGSAFSDYGGEGKVHTIGAATVTRVATNDIVVCFASGTRIRTTRGDVAVEALAVGDTAVTASGGTRPIVWLGHLAIGCRPGAPKANPGPKGGRETALGIGSVPPGSRARFAPRDDKGGMLPADLWPIRIRAHAFGQDLPERELFLSPGHPVPVGSGANEVLVPIMCLINGTSIARVPVDSVTYWHVELDQHDILLAEGLPAESFLDYGNRAWFENGGDHALTNPDFIAPGLGSRCRRVAVDGPSVEAERRRLDGLFEMSLATQCAWPSAEIIEVGF